MNFNTSIFIKATRVAYWAKGISANGDTEKSKGRIHSLYSCTNYVPKNAGNTGDVKSDLYPE